MLEDYDRYRSMPSKQKMENLMNVRNVRRSSRRPPMLVVGAKLCLMIDLVSRNVRINDDRLGTALVFAEWGMFVPDGRRVAFDADEQHVGRLQRMGKHDTGMRIPALIYSDSLCHMRRSRG